MQVFEPSEIAARFLTADDDVIRAADMPERMQLTTSSLSPWDPSPLSGFPTMRSALQPNGLPLGCHPGSETNISSRMGSTTIYCLPLLWR